MLTLLFCLSVAQYGDSSGIGAGMTLGGGNGFGNNAGNNNNNNQNRPEPPFFRDGRDGDIRGLWSFGVNGFFIPPPDFAGLPFLSSNGTIIPTAAVGLICFDGVGGCTLELTAVVGGNLGRQVFNVSMNKVRFISNLCRVRVSRLGRVIVTAKLSEVSTRLLPVASLSIPIVIVAQLASRNFAFIEFDQLFVLEGQAVRIRRFDLNNNNNNQDDKSVGPGGPGGPNGMDNWGNVAGTTGSSNRNNGNIGNVCPNLLDDSQFSDNIGSGSGGSSNNHGSSNNYGSYDPSDY